ncbi:MAG TPA: MarR family transcriptional regulator [Bacteroidales bacterium]|jgi:predicted transcriptional regulator|nr:MarR family transcriptional regulator [Bacteroidales bacterium]HNV96198.1 MarR family transcriptional regulator [Bacteroidales bacterium]HOU98353.1 MarR family transcriptional regulator [Bacteroidales bacterium]
METTKTILDAMKKSGKALKAGEIAELTGIDKKEVDKAIKQLVAESKISSPKRCYYEAK